MRPPYSAPLEVTREEGRRRAIEELSDPVYGQGEPSLLDRILMWLGELLDRLGRAGEGVIPGSWLLAGVLLVVLVLVVAMIFYLRPSRNRRVEAALHEGEVRTAADHRALSESAEAAGDFAAAVTERLRAISVDLEDRVIITPKAGRTATELAAEAARTLPGEAEGLHEGARIFNDVAYGDRAATADTARFMRELDGRLSAASPVLTDDAPTASTDPLSHVGGQPSGNQPHGGQAYGGPAHQGGQAPGNPVHGGQAHGGQPHVGGQPSGGQTHGGQPNGNSSPGSNHPYDEGRR